MILFKILYIKLFKLFQLLLYKQFKLNIKNLISKLNFLEELKLNENISPFLLLKFKLLKKYKNNNLLLFLNFHRNELELKNLYFTLNFKKKKKKSNNKKNKLIKYSRVFYIIHLTITNSNTFINITDIKGNSKAFYSAGQLKLKGSFLKTKQPITTLKLIKRFVMNLKILKNKNAFVHFTNYKINQSLILLRLLKNYVVIKSIRYYTRFPTNGCRLKKIRRIKMKG